MTSVTLFDVILGLNYVSILENSYEKVQHGQTNQCTVYGFDIMLYAATDTVPFSSLTSRFITDSTRT